MKISNSSNRLKELMREYCVTQADIAERTHIDKSTLSMYVSGKREPRQDKIGIIADAYGVDPSWLMGYDVPMRRERNLNSRAYIIGDAGRDVFEEYQKKMLQQMMVDILHDKVYENVDKITEPIQKCLANDEMAKRINAYAEKLLELYDMEHFNDKKED